MTALELAERDLKHAEINLKRSHFRPGVPDAEMAHMAELVELRKQIVEVLKCQKP